MAEFQADKEIRVVVMAGAGEKAFVSGADFSEFENYYSGKKEDEDGCINQTPRDKDLINVVCYLNIIYNSSSDELNTNLIK